MRNDDGAGVDRAAQAPPRAAHVPVPGLQRDQGLYPQVRGRLTRQSPAPALGQRGFVRPATGALGERAGRVHLITDHPQRSSASRKFPPIESGTRHSNDMDYDALPVTGWLSMETTVANQNQNERENEDRPGQQQGGNPKPGQQQQQPGQGRQQGGQQGGQGGQQGDRQSDQGGQKQNR